MKAGKKNEYTGYGTNKNPGPTVAPKKINSNPHYLSTLKERIAARFFVGNNPDILLACGLGDDTFSPEILAAIKEIESVN